MKKEALTKRKLHNLLAELETSPGDYLTIYVKPSSFPHYINELSLESKCSMYADEIKQSVNTKALVQETEGYNTGVGIFWQGNGNKYVVLPPFPITENAIFIGKLNTSLLCETLERKYIMGVVLVTWGSYAVGVFDHDELIESKVGTGYIHKGHRKGGRSERRFARRTEEQKKDFLRKVSNRVEEKFKNYNLDYLFFGGNRLILKPLVKECQYLEFEAHKISGRVLNSRRANKKALNHSIEEITQSLLLTF